jgi:RNA polymerase sigma factor (TIGR02999 family)
MTQLLKRAAQGDVEAHGELWKVVYDRLRGLAIARMREERPDHPLQPTALVNEAYLRVAELHRLDWRDRKHFFGVVGGVMRRILVDEARSRDAAKRGGGERLVPLDTSQIMPQMRNDQLVELDDAMKRLAGLDERQAKIVELRFFVGLTVAEIAELLEVSPRTVEGDWSMARTWLRQQLRAAE